jgi:hypothetical protein
MKKSAVDDEKAERAKIFLLLLVERLPRRRRILSIYPYVVRSVGL